MEIKEDKQKRSLIGVNVKKKKKKRGLEDVMTPCGLPKFKGD